MIGPLVDDDRISEYLCVSSKKRYPCVGTGLIQRIIAYRFVKKAFHAPSTLGKIPSVPLLCKMELVSGFFGCCAPHYGVR